MISNVFLDPGWDASPLKPRDDVMVAVDEAYSIMSIIIIVPYYHLVLSSYCRPPIVALSHRFVQPLTHLISLGRSSQSAATNPGSLSRFFRSLIVSSIHPVLLLLSAIDPIHSLISPLGIHPNAQKSTIASSAIVLDGPRDLNSRAACRRVLFLLLLSPKLTTLGSGVLVITSHVFFSSSHQHHQ